MIFPRFRDAPREVGDRHAQDITAPVHGTDHRFLRHTSRGALQRRECLFRIAVLLRGGEGGAARPVEEAGLQRACGLRRVRRGCEDVRPLTEAHEHEQFLRRERFEHGHLVRHRIRELRRAYGACPCFGQVAREHRRRRFELEVVSVVAHRVKRLRALRTEIRLIHRRRGGVGPRRAPVLAGADVDVRRHVHEVAGSRHERLEAGCRRGRTLRCARGLHRVDVIMVRPRVRGLLREYALDLRGDRWRPRFGRAVGRVKAPWMKIHQAFGVERADVGVIGKPPGQHAHRVGIRRFAHRLVSGGSGHVPSAERRHESLLDVAAIRGETLRDREMRIRLDQTLGRCRIVDVGAERECHAPVRHRRKRVVCRRPYE